MRVLYPDHTPFERIESIEKCDRDYYPHSIHHQPVMPRLEIEIKEKGIHQDEKIKSESTKRESKKIHSKPYKSTVESVQEEL